MICCHICKKEFDGYNGLAKHIFNSHKEINKEQYYVTYINGISSVCICGKKKKFRSLSEGYRRFCSCKCRTHNIGTTAAWEGKKQPQSMIDKRRNTMIERYGVANGFLTKQSRTERYKGFICRSNYEKYFVDFAEKFGYTLSVPNRIPYEYEGRSRYYYPDFYVEELDLIVEIKSNWTWKQHLHMNTAKLASSIEQGYNIVFLDEEHGIKDEKLWGELNEYLRTFE